MLSTSNLSAAQAKTYYSKEDYYSKEEKAHPTKWVGKGAAVLGLSGMVNQQDFSNLLAGKSPDGQSLTGRVVDPEKRRAGTDFTFSAPKSVSIAALVQQDERVLGASSGGQQSLINFRRALCSDAGFDADRAAKDNHRELGRRSLHPLHQSRGGAAIA